MYLIRRLTVKIDYLTQLGIGFSAVGVAISYSDIYLFHIWFLFLGLVWFAQLKNSQYLFSINKRVDKYFLFLLSMFFWYGLSILWSPNIILSMKYLFYIFCGIIISFTIIRFSEDIDQLNKIYKTLSIVFIIEIIIALLESFNLFRWPISPYSSWSTFFGKESINYFNFGNLAVFYDFSPPTGFHWNTNNLAITMILILPFFLCHKKI